MPQHLWILASICLLIHLASINRYLLTIYHPWTISEKCKGAYTLHFPETLTVKGLWPVTVLLSLSKSKLRTNFCPIPEWRNGLPTSQKSSVSGFWSKYGAICAHLLARRLQVTTKHCHHSLSNRKGTQDNIARRRNMSESTNIFTVDCVTSQTF